MPSLSRIANPDFEAQKILELIRANTAAGARVLDVGCGYGRNLRHLRDAGFDAFGLEKNPRIVKENQTRGLACGEPSSLPQYLFDVLLLSHIVEHFSPSELKDLLAQYLSHLKPGGLLVIATPLMSPWFYDDYDHVRPYHPESFLLLYSQAGDSQMQYQANASLSLLDLWYRRSPPQLAFCRGRHISGFSRKLYAVTNLGLRVLHLLTFRFFGTTTGWVGIFRYATGSSSAL